jgi:hypothetical protein
MKTNPSDIIVLPHKLVIKDVSGLLGEALDQRTFVLVLQPDVNNHRTFITPLTKSPRS